MPILNNGNGLQTSTDYVVANPDFANEATSKVLGQTSQSNSQLDAAAGPLDLGYQSTPFTYFDEAVSNITGLGRYYETTSNHNVPQNASALIINVPASVYPQSVANVGNRFMR
jgi:hypothetical protein